MLCRGGGYMFYTCLHRGNLNITTICDVVSTGQQQIVRMYFLVNASPPTTLDVGTSEKLQVHRSHDKEVTGHHCM